MPLLVEEGDALAAHAQLLAAGRAFGNLEGDGAADGGDFDLRAQGGLGKADGEDAAQVVAVALEELMGADGEDDVEVALGRAGASGVAFAGVADAGSALDAGRHLDVELESLW